jgi:Family of unknown function (DUF6150)
MKKLTKIGLLIFTVLFCNVSNAQKIFSVDYESQADVKVFVVDYESQADLKVFKVKYESQAVSNEGKWFFVKYASQAKKKIYFVKYESQSGWRNSSKKSLMY